MKNEKGFTLIEVLASLVIISIVLSSFMAIFSNTNALAVSNSEKLVVINLADAYLERVKVEFETRNNRPDSSEESNYLISFPLELNDCTEPGEKKDCLNVLLDNLPTINDKKYDVLFSFSQKRHDNGNGKDNGNKPDSEKDLSLVNVVVTVTAKESNISSSVEGYVHYEETD